MYVDENQKNCFETVKNENSVFVECNYKMHILMLGLEILLWLGS